MHKFLTIMVTLLAVVTVLLTTYGGDLALQGITAQAAATDLVQPRLVRKSPKSADDGMAINFEDKLFGPVEEPEERVTIETSDVLEAKEKLELLLKHSGRTNQITTTQTPMVHVSGGMS